MKDQIKKLIYNKKIRDTPEGTHSEWRLGTWKILLWQILAVVLLVLGYSYIGTKSPRDFLSNIVFYAIVILIACAILWVVGRGLWKARKTISRFFLAFILLIGVYWIMGFFMGWLNMLDFYKQGYALWIMVTILAGWGVRNIDGKLDRQDVFYACLVLIVFLFANIPISNGEGFLWNVDNLFKTLMSFVSNLGFL